MNEVWIASVIVLWILVLLIAFLLAGTLRQLGLIQLRLGDDPGALITDTGLDRGTLAPDFEAIDSESGSTRRLSDYPAQARMLVFLSPGCLACSELVPGLNEVRATRAHEADFLVVCRGDVESCRSFSRVNGLDVPMLIDVTGNIEREYEVTLTPFAYFLDYERRVLIRGVTNDWRHLESLLEQEGTQLAERLFPTPEDAPVNAQAAEIAR